MKSHGRIRFVWLGSAIVALSLCGGLAVRSQSVSSEPAKPVSKAGASTPLRVDQPTVILEKDFGVLRPHEEVTGTFELTNSTNSVWTLKQIQNSCSCTTASISKKRLQPGDTSKITVAYKAGGSTQDAVKLLRVDFMEADSPVALLTIKAKIRKPLSVSVSDLQIRTSGEAQTGAGSFEVFNYTATRWPSVRVKSSVEWLAVEAARIESAPGKLTNGEPLEVWRVSIVVAMAGGNYGRQRGDVEVEAAGVAGGAVIIPVSVDVVRPLNAVPESLFLGSVPAGKPVRKSVRLIATPGEMPIRLDELQISTESKLISNLEIEDVAARTFRLHAEFAPSNIGLIEGAISVRLRGQLRDLVTIRFQANVIAEESSL